MSWYNPSMLCLLRLLFDLFIRSIYSRRNLLLENLALRRQLAVLKRRHPKPRLALSEKLLLVDFAAALVSMEGGIDSHSAGDSCSLASGRVQAVLDVALAASCPCWKKMRQQGSAPTHLPHGC
jgi:hypothetical protein